MKLISRAARRGSAVESDVVADEHPYDPGHEFGPELDALADEIDEVGELLRTAGGDERLPDEHSPRWCGVGPALYVAEATAAAAEGATTIRLKRGSRRVDIELPYAVAPTGVAGFIAPAHKPTPEAPLADAVETVDAARDRHMRSRRIDEDGALTPVRPTRTAPPADGVAGVVAEAVDAQVESGGEA